MNFTHQLFMYLVKLIVFLHLFAAIDLKMVYSGGALKPTDVDTLWVHVSCAWFRREVSFLDHEKMEPAVGILKIPPTTFLKVKLSSE